MAPPPLPLFSPSPKPPPPPPWLHGPSPQNHEPPNPAEAAPSKPSSQSPNQPQQPRNTGPRPPAKAKPLTAGVPGGRTRRAVLGIIRRVRSLELSDPPTPVPKRNSDAPADFILPFELPLWEQDQGQGEDEERPRPRAVPWAAAKNEDLKAALRREKKLREPTRAERELPADELERLRRAARGMDRWARAKKAGITDEVVEEVRQEWDRGQELAAVRLVEPLCRCMDRAREILEVV